MKELLDPKWLVILASVVEKTPECTEHHHSKEDLSQSETNNSHLHVLLDFLPAESLKNALLFQPFVANFFETCIKFELSSFSG